MSAEKVTLEFTDDGCAILTMRNGQNRLNSEFIQLINDKLDEALRNKNCRALITTGEGKFYSNGIDLEWMLKQNKDKLKQFGLEVESLFWRIIHYPLPTVAVLNGHTFAGGAFLAAGHDYRVMNSKQGWFCWNETRVGLRIPPVTREILFVKVKNINAIREAALFARYIPGPEAKSLGLVDEVAELPALIDVAKRLVLQAVGKTGLDRNMLEAMKKDLYPNNVKDNDGFSFKSKM